MGESGKPQPPTKLSYPNNTFNNLNGQKDKRNRSSDQQKKGNIKFPRTTKAPNSAVFLKSKLSTPDEMLYNFNSKQDSTNGNTYAKEWQKGRKFTRLGEHTINDSANPTKDSRDTTCYRCKHKNSPLIIIYQRQSAQICQCFHRL